MIFRTLAMSVMTLIFSTSISSHFFQIGTTQGEFSFAFSNQALTLFMPTESLITSEAASSNDESC
jgi:hypothetical protein